jgi:hypothetical protein
MGRVRMKWPVFARKVCIIGIAGLDHRTIECVLRESWRAAVALFQIARLESDQGDGSALPVLMAQERGVRPRTAVGLIARRVGSCWRPIVATWRLIVFSLWTGDARGV